MRRLEDEESDDEGAGENATEDREAIANTLFDGSDNVSNVKNVIYAICINHYLQLYMKFRKKKDQFRELQELNELTIII